MQVAHNWRAEKRLSSKRGSSQQVMQEMDGIVSHLLMLTDKLVWVNTWRFFRRTSSSSFSPFYMFQVWRDLLTVKTLTSFSVRRHFCGLRRRDNLAQGYVLYYSRRILSFCGFESMFQIARLVLFEFDAVLANRWAGSLVSSGDQRRRRRRRRCY